MASNELLLLSLLYKLYSALWYTGTFTKMGIKNQIVMANRIAKYRLLG